MSNGLFLRQLTGMSIWIKPIQHWCRWTSTCFLLTLYNSLKNFLSGISNSIFFTSPFFNAFFSKNGLLGRALSTRSTPSFVFLCQDAAFFSFILVLFSKRSQRLDGNHRLKSSGQELKSTEEFTGKIQGHSLSLACTFPIFGWVHEGNPPVHYFDWNRSCTLKVSK